jgi:tetratricopeptide (TPR) repeat protein
MTEMTIDRMMQSALGHHQSGRLSEAEQLYRQVLGQQPTHARAMYYLGVIAQQSGRNDIAVDLLRRAAALDPDRAEGHYRVGMVLRELGQFDGAIAACRRALALEAKFPAAYGVIADAQKDKGSLDEAEATYRQFLALSPNSAEAHYVLGVLLHRQGQIDAAIAELRVSDELNFRKHKADWKTPGTGMDPSQLTQEFERVAAHTAKECSLTVIAGEEFAASEGVQAYLGSLARVLSGDHYVFAHGLSAEREGAIQRFGLKIAHVPRMEHLLCDRWWLYDSFIGATRYERYLITDSKDVVFQGNPFDYSLDEEWVVLAGEGTLHRDSIWNIKDQAALQGSLGVALDFKDWQVVNGGLQYGTRKKMKALAGQMCREMSRPITSTDQAVLNYVYHTSLRNDPGYVVASSDTQAFCVTCGPICEGAVDDGHELRWNGKELYSPRVGVYQIVHQWERTPFARQIANAHIALPEKG